MPNKLLPVLLFLFSSQVLAVEFPIEISEYIDDVKVDAFINEEDLMHSKKWMPFDSSPPLSMNQALNAIKESEGSGIDFSKAKVVAVELKPVPHHKSYWHYLVDLKVMSDEGPESVYYVVLMNGKVIPAIKEPESIK
jgi:hypothetical protein